MQIVCQGERQNFRLTSLGWTEARNPYVIYVGQYKRLPTRRQWRR